MTFDVRVQQQTFKNLVPAFTTDFGLWNSGRPMEFELNAGQSFSSELGAKVVYKIATVVVSYNLTEKLLLDTNYDFIDDRV